MGKDSFRTLPRFTGDVPPFLHHFLPILIGVLLLLRRYQVSSEQSSLQEQKNRAYGTIG